jgi:hypothetical protein
MNNRPNPLFSLSSALLLSVLTGAVLGGCATAKPSAEEMERTALMDGTGFRCRYVPQGDKPQNLELQLNIAMAGECDPKRPFAITPYISDSLRKRGVVYCCSKEPGKQDFKRPEASELPPAGISQLPQSSQLPQAMDTESEKKEKPSESSASSADESKNKK